MTERRNHLELRGKLFGRRIARSVQNRKKAASRRALLRMMPRGSVCAEIGVWKGDFSHLILKIVKPTKLHLVDPWRFEAASTFRGRWYAGAKAKSQEDMDEICHGVVRRFGEQVERGQVEIHRSTSDAAAERFPPDYFDWVYIDGNHSYEFVKRDLQNFYATVKPGGFLVGDDYRSLGVRRAVDEFAAEGKRQMTIMGTQFVFPKPGVGIEADASEEMMEERG